MSLKTVPKVTEITFRIRDEKITKNPVNLGTDMQYSPSSMEAAHYYKRWDLAQLCEGKIVASLSESTICDVLLDLALKIPQSRNAQ
ncbi:hypothetical protein BGZ97_001669 [Linnemannia gamsii]|uniref:Uncharacterized protein n=1 Tax=Linnemannia gamsii TaxID=64522 RepID=A0A9P6RGJ2_9FUNG|nr:hypothetical protein BGZ97_001669 [Linnemannia gamsii]